MKDLKRELLEILRDEMRGMAKEEKNKSRSELLKPKSMQKVTVMADSKEGLKKGLSKAEELMKAKLGENMMDDESQEDEYICPECEGMGEDCECEEEDEE